MEKRPAPEHPIDILWRAQALISIVLAGEGLALILTFAPGYGGDRWVYFGLCSFMIQWVALLSISIMYTMRTLLVRLHVHFISWLALAIVMLNTWLVCSLFLFADRSFSGVGQKNAIAFVTQATVVALTVGLLGIIALQHYWRGHQLALANKQAQLNALQARIQPHFLFNTLNTGAALVHQHPALAEQLLLDLSELFRAALSESKSNSLEQELLLARRYLEIETLRFGSRIRIRWQLPDKIPEIFLPALSIQPLVENAVIHGIEPYESGGDIDINFIESNGLGRVIISNSLPEKTKSVRKGHQIGIAGTKERIENFYENRGSVTTAIENGRYIATISIPMDS